MALFSPKMFNRFEVSLCKRPTDMSNHVCIIDIICSHVSGHSLFYLEFEAYNVDGRFDAKGNSM